MLVAAGSVRCAMFGATFKSAQVKSGEGSGCRLFYIMLYV